MDSGFDRSPPAGELRQGIEILREYLDAQGQPVTAVRSGDEIVVRLRMRAIDADYIANVTVIDMLPGGFEPVLSPPADGSEAPAPAAEPQAPPAGSWFNRLGSGGNWRPEYADVREDRVALRCTAACRKIWRSIAIASARGRESSHRCAAWCTRCAPAGWHRCRCAPTRPREHKPFTGSPATHTWAVRPSARVWRGCLPNRGATRCEPLMIEALPILVTSSWISCREPNIVEPDACPRHA
jgi:hypothetical protein